MTERARGVAMEWNGGSERREKRERNRSKGRPMRNSKTQKKSQTNERLRKPCPEFKLYAIQYQRDIAKFVITKCETLETYSSTTTASPASHHSPTTPILHTGTPLHPPPPIFHTPNPTRTLRTPGLKCSPRNAPSCFLTAANRSPAPGASILLKTIRSGRRASIAASSTCEVRDL